MIKNSGKLLSKFISLFKFFFFISLRLIVICSCYASRCFILNVKWRSKSLKLMEKIKVDKKFNSVVSWQIYKFFWPSFWRWTVMAMVKTPLFIIYLLSSSVFYLPAMASVNFKIPSVLNATIVRLVCPNNFQLNWLH